MSLLAKILDAKRSDLPRLRSTRLPEPPATRKVALARGPGEPLSLIAEFKRCSPSAGMLSTALTLAQRVAAYEAGGAKMVSVLCDARFFAGRYQDLSDARAACGLPVLCKEFIIDEVQLDFARAYGADAALLIVRCLEPNRLGALIRACAERTLVPLVEIHTDREAQLALDAGATMMGVNARDLDTLEMDVEGAARVLEALPPGITRIHLSGLSRAEQVEGVARSAADAALIGEALMRQDDPGPLLRELVAAGSVGDVRH
jgi:indole-3-glycerol phosphate synthase